MVPKKSWFCFQVPNFLFYLQMIAVPYLDIYNVSCACLWYFLPKSLWPSHIWYIYWPLDIFCNRKCRDNATDTQSQGDPKIVKRGPNFEQKGDLFDVKGDQNLNFSELFTKSENVKIVKKSHSFVFSNKLTYNWLAYTFNMLNVLQMIRAAILLRSLV